MGKKINYSGQLASAEIFFAKLIVFTRKSLSDFRQTLLEQVIKFALNFVNLSMPGYH